MKRAYRREEEETWEYRLKDHKWMRPAMRAAAKQFWQEMDAIEEPGFTMNKNSAFVPYRYDWQCQRKGKLPREQQETCRKERATWCNRVGKKLCITLGHRVLNRN